ncbi:MAG: FAD-dependent oxidoreductase [Hyphomicrobium sp.]
MRLRDSDAINQNQGNGAARSLWAAVTKARTPSPPIDSEVRADVAIVGAGFTGLSTALSLVERGRSVAVVEAAEVGYGASGRNSGQVIPTMSGIDPDDMARLGGAAGERFVLLVRDSASSLFDLVRRNAIDCEAEQSGWFQPAHSPRRANLSARRVEAWARRGAPVRLLDANETRALIGSDFWHGGMLNTSGGHINPLALARGLADRVAGKGGRIFERSPALGIAQERRGWVVSTASGRIIADRVLIATNAYTDRFSDAVAPDLARDMIPVVTWQMATTTQSDALRRDILPGRQAVSDTRGDLRFFRWDARGRLITGGALIVPFAAQARLRRIVGARLAEAFPQMGIPEFDYVWSGRIGMTADRMPRFHEMAPGLFAWTACNGRGIALSVALGDVLARALDGADRRELPIPITPVRPYPLHQMATFGAPLLLAHYRLRDRL